MLASGSHTPTETNQPHDHTLAASTSDRHRAESDEVFQVNYGSVDSSFLFAVRSRVASEIQAKDAGPTRACEYFCVCACRDDMLTIGARTILDPTATSNFDLKRATLANKL